MVDPKGYYSILGVSTNSSYTQIKRAYRDLALKYHPDRNKSSMAADMMKKINEAYDVLSDKQKRIDYDNGKDIVGHPIRDSHKTYTKYSTYSSDNDKGKNSNKSYSYYNNAYYNFNNQSKQEYYLKNTVSVWWQILFSLIPFVNFVAFARIQRLEMAISSLFPILIGIIVLLTIVPGYPFFSFKI